MEVSVIKMLYWTQFALSREKYRPRSTSIGQPRIGEKQFFPISPNSTCLGLMGANISGGG
jgi:hypothetical protein